MKKHAIKFILIFLFTLSGLSATTQEIQFRYDDTGNRLSREPVYPENIQLNLVDHEDDPHESTRIGDLVVKLYPNPGPGIFWLELSTREKDIPKDLRLTVTNGDGELVFALRVIGLKTQIDLRTLPSGSYVLTLSHGKYSLATKVIKT